MSFIFHALISLCLVIIQTTIFHTIDLFKHFYDLIIPYIIYLGVCRSFRSSIPLVLISGLIMDSIVGGPLGLYITIYIWLYLASRWVVQYLHEGNIVLVAILIAVGVIVENLIIFAVLLIQSPLHQISIRFITLSLNQAVWGLFTGPVIFICLKYTQSIIGAWDYLGTKQKDKLNF